MRRKNALTKIRVHFAENLPFPISRTDRIATSSVRKLNESTPKWNKKERKEEYIEKFAFAYAGNRCKFVVRVWRTRMHSANAFDVRPPYITIDLFN